MAPKTITPFPKIGDDSASQVAGFSGDASAKISSSLKAPGLSKNKLADLQREYQESQTKSIAADKKDDVATRSKVGSQMPSIAPSKAKTKMSQYTQLSKIPEELNEKLKL